MNPSQLALAFLSGIISTFSPCVLPAIPMVASSSLAAHRFGPMALGLGLVSSFTLIGSLIAISGNALGFDADQIRMGSGLLIFFAGLLLTFNSLQVWMTAKLSYFATRANSIANRVRNDGLIGQFAIGSLLGAIWSPCTGPLLGVAIGLASSQENRIAGVIMISIFSLGSALPLVLLSYASRRWFIQNKSRIIERSSAAKKIIGFALIVISITILTGVDRIIEARMIDHMPDFWIDFIGKF